MRPDRLYHLQWQEGNYCTIKGFMFASTYCTDVPEHKHHPKVQTRTLTPPPHPKNMSFLSSEQSPSSITRTHTHSGSILLYTTTSMEGVKWNQALWALTWLTEVWIPHTLTVSCISTKHQRGPILNFWCIDQCSWFLWYCVGFFLHLKLFYNIFLKSIHPDTFHKKTHVDRPYLRGLNPQLTS